MSETAPERSGGGGFLSRRLGPVPVWGWLAGVTALGVAYYLIAGRKGSAQGAAAGAGGAGSETPSSDVPDYISQTTVNLTEPAEPAPPSTTAPKPPVTAPAPPPGKQAPLPEPTAKPPSKKVTPVKPRPIVKQPAPKAPAKQPPVFSNKYTVKAGDTLDALAKKFGVTRVELAHANGLGTGAGLKTGQVLKVPGPVKTRAQGGPG